MLRLLAAALLFAPAAPAFAQADPHVAEAGAIRIVHPWARAAAAGGATLAFMEIVNGGEPDVLVSAHADIAASAAIVGLMLAGGEAGWIEIGPIEIPAGDFDLDPGGLAIALTGLAEALPEGGAFELTLAFRQAGDIRIHVEVEAADAARHSHAGHAH